MASVDVDKRARPARPGAPHPSGDNRFKLLESTMKRLQYQPDALIEVLHKAQELFGFLSGDLLIYIAHSLKLPPSRVYGVATFYNQFRFRPLGRYHVQVCRGTACHVKGSQQTLQAIQRALNITPGQTTRDGQFSLEVVACLGACGLAPVMAVNGEFFAGATSDRVGRILRGFKREAVKK